MPANDSVGSVHGNESDGVNKREREKMSMRAVKKTEGEDRLIDLSSSI